MNSAVQFTVLLACITICSSAVIKNCRCVNSIKAVNPKMIVEVRVLKPRPYCSKCEVIVTLKDKRSKCLDPESQFTKFVLGADQKTCAKMSTAISKTATAASTTAVTSS
ncbi:alveolar macrophage chemotactic factor [Nothobranchius furzeri]|uniref:Alveolar macrophage chemotactic factor-like n=2 Tax=Nothobranchius furzeri TaxID=105023 RepID=A0A9D2Z134_NOTFU|nr:alveolar macrophage chemotactic factor-like [Nothobranchius furzeri]